MVGETSLCLLQDIGLAEAVSHFQDAGAEDFNCGRTESYLEAFPSLVIPEPCQIAAVGPNLVDCNSQTKWV